MPHKAREADSCGSGAEMVSNGRYQTTAHTMGDLVMDGWKIKNWSESGSNDRVDAFSELFGLYYSVECSRLFV
jgi:hypothetical protein